MPSDTRHPLTGKERKDFRLSFYWAVVGAGLYVGTLLLSLVPHEFFQSDFMGIPLCGSLAAAAFSAALAFPLAQKRPICLLWSAGVPFVEFGVVPAIVVLMAILRTHHLI